MRMDLITEHHLWVIHELPHMQYMPKVLMMDSPASSHYCLIFTFCVFHIHGGDTDESKTTIFQSLIRAPFHVDSFRVDGAGDRSGLTEYVFPCMRI